MNELDSLVASARELFAQAATPVELENAKAQFLGKAGKMTELMKGMAQLSVEEKKTRGAAINVTKQAIEAALTERRNALAEAQLQVQLQAERLDVTLPGRQRGQGGLHPVSLTLERIEGIFASMGFEVAEGPEIESDWFNFTALNTPEDHPARSMHDTFYVEGGTPQAPNLLRTHTSPMQVRHAVQHVKRYRNQFGQLAEHAPFCERDIRRPHSLETHDKKGEFRMMIKKQGIMHEMIYATHPFDVVGWDGYNYPYVGATYHERSYIEAGVVTALDSRIAEPGRTIMFADSAMPQEDYLTEDGLLYAPYYPSPENPLGDPTDPDSPAWPAAPSMHFRHDGRANVVWCDGHVTSERWGWAHSRKNVFDGDNYRWGVGWFGPRNNSLFYTGPKSDYGQLVATDD